MAPWQRDSRHGMGNDGMTSWRGGKVVFRGERFQVARGCLIDIARGDKLSTNGLSRRGTWVIGVMFWRTKFLLRFTWLRRGRFTPPSRNRHAPVDSFIEADILGGLCTLTAVTLLMSQASQGEDECPGGREQHGGALHKESVRRTSEAADHPSTPPLSAGSRRGGNTPSIMMPMNPRHVDAPDIEGIIPAEAIFKSDGIEADDTGDYADQAGDRRRNEAGRRSNGGQSATAPVSIPKISVSCSRSIHHQPRHRGK